MTGHGTQHEHHAQLGDRSRSQAAPRPPVQRPEGSCAAGAPARCLLLPPPGGVLGSVKLGRGRRLAAAQQNKTRGRAAEGKTALQGQGPNVGAGAPRCGQGRAEGRAVGWVYLGHHFPPSRAGPAHSGAHTGL